MTEVQDAVLLCSASSIRPSCCRNSIRKGRDTEEGEHIRDGLADLHAEQPVGAGQDEDERDEEHALSAAGQEGGPAGRAHALEGHVGHHDDGLQQHGQALVVEGGQRHGGISTPHSLSPLSLILSMNLLSPF